MIRALMIWAFGILVLRASAQTTATVSSSADTVSNRKYWLYDYTDPATKQFRVVIPAGVKTVRGLLVECNYRGSDSRADWTFYSYYREFMHLHDFALIGSAGDPSHVRPRECSIPSQPVSRQASFIALLVSRIEGMVR